MIESHHAETSKELDLLVGDVVTVDNKMESIWNGYEFGVNERTNNSGFYPNYKVYEAWQIFNVPDFVL